MESSAKTNKKILNLKCNDLLYADLFFVLGMQMIHHTVTVQTDLCPHSISNASPHTQAT